MSVQCILLVMIFAWFSIYLDFKFWVMSASKFKLTGWNNIRINLFDKLAYRVNRSLCVTSQTFDSLTIESQTCLVQKFNIKK